MATQRFELPATHLSTRVGRKPRIKLWVNCFATETEIPGGDGSLAVLATALGTVGKEDEKEVLLPWSHIFICDAS